MSNFALNPLEVESFKRNGFLIKRKALDITLAERTVSRVWSELPSSFRKDNPASWTGRVTDCCETRAVDQRRGRLRYRQCLRTEPLLLDLIPKTRIVDDCVKQFLGSTKTSRDRIRGVYLVLPCDPTAHLVSPHNDRHIFQLGVVGYLRDVSTEGGAFTVWPGSHHWVSKHVPMQQGPLRSDPFRTTVAGGFEGEPLLLPGQAGDLIFYHHRILHAAGQNYSSNIQYAAFCDFARQGIFRSQSINNTHGLWADWNIG